MDKQAFLARVGEYHEGGWRLALINATTVPSPDEATPGVFELTWAFAKDLEFETIRETIVLADEVPSVSEFFGAAFLYENEMRELFGLNVTGIGLDLQGQLYKTSTKIPFSHAAVKARLEATAAATAAASGKKA
jgi:ech hydrogenase subunit D